MRLDVGHALELGTGTLLRRPSASGLNDDSIGDGIGAPLRGENI
jgi:hypothetical protein